MRGTFFPCVGVAYQQTRVHMCVRGGGGSSDDWGEAVS